jgi:hypothetical protein
MVAVGITFTAAPPIYGRRRRLLAKYLHRISAMDKQYLHRISAMDKQYLHSNDNSYWSIYLHSNFSNICTAIFAQQFQQCISNICTAMHKQYLHSNICISNNFTELELLLAKYLHSNDNS